MACVDKNQKLKRTCIKSAVSLPYTDDIEASMNGSGK